MAGHFPSGRTVSGHFPSGRSRIRALSFWTQPCQGIFLLDAAMSGYFPAGRIVSRQHGHAGCQGAERRHQEKKSASGCTGCVRTHQALGTLWTHTGRAHTAPNAKRTGNVNSDAARHGTMHSDAICQGAMYLDTALHGICLPDGVCKGIFLLDAAVSEHFPSGRSRVRANDIQRTHIMVPRSRCLSRHGTSQQILLSHSQTRSRFQV